MYSLCDLMRQHHEMRERESALDRKFIAASLSGADQFQAAIDEHYAELRRELDGESSSEAGSGAGNGDFGSHPQNAGGQPQGYRNASGMGEQETGDRTNVSGGGLGDDGSRGREDRTEDAGTEAAVEAAKPLETGGGNRDGSDGSGSGDGGGDGDSGSDRPTETTGGDTTGDGGTDATGGADSGG